MKTIAVLLSFSCLVLAYASCPPTSLAFEPPTHLANSSIFHEAIEALKGTLNQAVASGETAFGPIRSNETSFSIDVFDTSSNGSLFSYQHSGLSLQESAEGTKRVDEDTIYRIGSVSKLITVYLFLVEAGPGYWNRSITEFIPELEERAANCSAASNPIDCVDWDGVTLGALASHVAGISRDYSGPGEVSSLGDLAVALGLPPLAKDAAPDCNLGLSDPCPTEVYVEGLASQHPIFAPYSSPTYSNGGFNLLAFALDNIIGQNMSEAVKPRLFDRLHMSRSTSALPEDLGNAAIPPGDLAARVFHASLACEIPAGGFFSTQNDLVKLGQSILSSSLLSPSVTREWLKPDTFNADITQAVGKPWEIWRTTTLTNRSLDLYTKSGDLFSYSSNIVLSPTYNVGVVILAAGNETSAVVRYLSDVVLTGIFPVLETVARDKSRNAFAGRYEVKVNDTSSSTPAPAAVLNSSLSITTRDAEPGFIIDSWISNGTDLLDVLAMQMGAVRGLDARLYPTHLVARQGNDGEIERVAYRASFEALPDAIGASSSSSSSTKPGIISNGCMSCLV